MSSISERENDDRRTVAMERIASALTSIALSLQALAKQQKP
jgi:hypothetical protein